MGNKAVRAALLPLNARPAVPRRACRRSPRTARLRRIALSLNVIEVILQRLQLTNDRRGETLPVAAVVNEETSPQDGHGQWVVPRERDGIYDPRMLLD